MNIPGTIQQAIRNATHLVVFTGAGVSAESGIPTFRDALTGLWSNFDAEALATPQAFRKDPAFVWGWYEWRRMKVQRAQPNPGHLAIAEMERQTKRFTLITQNVDDLHERAGSSAPVHLHGRINRPYCFSCGEPFTYAAGITEEPEGGRRLDPPRCAKCGGLIRPGVVWFGESLPSDEWDVAYEAAQDCDVFLCVGTSSLVQPAAQLTMMAIQNGAVTIQVNPNATDLDSRVTLNLNGPSGKMLPLLIKAVWG
jgi:NAD-dependent deacetylase